VRPVNGPHDGKPRLKSPPASTFSKLGGEKLSESYECSRNGTLCSVQSIVLIRVHVAAAILASLVRASSATWPLMQGSDISNRDISDVVPTSLELQIVVLCSHASNEESQRFLPTSIQHLNIHTPFLSATTFKYPYLVSIAKSIICTRPLFAL
jgi:hypothetical protein